MSIAGEVVGRSNGETNTDICTLPCAKEVASENLLWSTGSSAQSSVMTSMGGAEGREGGPRRRGYMYT